MQKDFARFTASDLNFEDHLCMFSTTNQVKNLIQVSLNLLLKLDVLTIEIEQKCPKIAKKVFLSTKSSAKSHWFSKQLNNIIYNTFLLFIYGCIQK